jgi:hypothetical protein
MSEPTVMELGVRTIPYDLLSTMFTNTFGNNKITATHILDLDAVSLKTFIIPPISPSS